MEELQTSLWNGSIFFINRRRIVFVGEAGNSFNQTIHAIKICIALNGDFELITNSRAKGDRYSAAIINAGIPHTVKCDGTKIFLLYLLPETQEARELRWEYLNNDKDNRRGGVYDIPKELVEESLPFLQQMLQNYSTWDCRETSKYSDEVIRGLGRIRRRQLSTSSDLSEELNANVKKTIDYIYTEIEAQRKTQQFDLKRFKASVICREINLPLNKAEWLEKEFRKEAGTTIRHFFSDIQMLAALKFYAVTKEMRKTEEKKLLQELERPNITEEERIEIGERLDEIPTGIFLTQIAKLLGFGKLTNFDKRIKSRIGISIADLKGQSNFFPCEEETDS